MARSRNIKPGFFTNADLAECSPMARLLFAGLWTIADKSGRLRDRPKHIKGQILPYDDCDVDALLNELATVEEPFIHRYATESTNYIQIANWHRHQSPHHTEQESDIPPPPKKCDIPAARQEEPLSNGVVTVGARRALNQESGINEEGIGDQESVPPTAVELTVSKKQRRPTLEEVRAYCSQRGNGVDPERFWHHYEANGWVQGNRGKPVQNWKSCVITWEKNNKGSPSGAADPNGTLAAANEYLADAGRS